MAVDNGKGKAPEPLYHQSSQYRHWRYSMEQLDEIRQELNNRAVQRVKAMIEKERSERTTGEASTSSTDAGTNGSELPPPPAEIEYLTVIDELQLVTYYLMQASALCNAFRFPESVQATAISYIKRFYLRNTCMDYHPKNVMLTCVFLASKVENCSISIDTFAAKTKTSPDDVLSLEFLVSQSLRFEYKVHHAHTAAQGLLLDMQASTSVAPDLIENAHQTATSNIKTSRLTDVEFCYTPSQIALSSYRMANADLVDEWLSAKRSRLPESDSSGGEQEQQRQLDDDALIESLDEIASIIEHTRDHPVDKSVVTDIDRRLHWARNPEKDPNSALYKKRKAEEDAQRQRKATEKASTEIDDDGSVFD